MDAATNVGLSLRGRPPTPVGRWGARGWALLAVAGTLALALGAGCAEAPPRAAEGAELYRAYCASCHGLEARGDGPLAPALAHPAADLTRIAQRNEGRFEESKVLSAIDGRFEVTAHGPREMPVWGAVFLEAHRGDPLPHLRGMDDARALVDYLHTLQVLEGAAAPQR